MEFSEIQKAINDIPDEVLSQIQVSMPWQPGIFRDGGRDPDGAKPERSSDKDLDSFSQADLQKECWNKFNKNPQVSTSVRGLAGRITGMGFEVSSEVWEIQEVLEEIEYDPRNRLYHYWPRYVTRGLIEGELFQCLTCHPDGFIEVDFIDPASLSTKGDNGSGIIFHPRKKLFPLFYILDVEDENGMSHEEQIPSINIARYPDLLHAAKGHKDFNRDFQALSMGSPYNRAFRGMAGYKRFVVAWDRGYLTRRAISYLRTIIEWLNHYENLKKFEIDHKKSSGSYTWAITFEDVKAFRLWINLSDEERKKTALMAPIEPGSKLFLPPGCKIEAKNPNLPKISDSDTDIMQMAISGMNEAADVTTGTVGGTYASVKATRGPMSDRTSDEVVDFDRFYRHDFWSSIFFLRSKLVGFPEFFEVEDAIRFENKKPIMKMVKKRPQFLIDVQYPISETIELDTRVAAAFGVKHGPLSESAGIPQSKAASMIGVGGYGKNRLRKAVEDKKYPDLVYAGGVDSESLQEKVEGERGKSKGKGEGNDA